MCHLVKSPQTNIPSLLDQFVNAANMRKCKIIRQVKQTAARELSPEPSTTRQIER